MYNFSNAWKKTTQCEGCSSKLRVLSRKEPCFSCKNYFCKVCIMRRPDKKMCCRKCQILTATPLDRNDLLNLRSRDLVNYLASKHISTSGCVEKEDLVNVLMSSSGSSSAQPVSNSSNSSYSNSPSKSVFFGDESDSNRKVVQPNNCLYNEDGIRITGGDVPENAGYCSSSDQSVKPEVVNEDIENHQNSNQGSEHNEENITEQSLHEAEHNTSSSKKKEEVASTKERTKPLQLSDISCSADLDNLSVKELKKLLMTNRTDFKGCIERAELLEKASRLWSDYTLSRKDLEKLSLEELCKICMDAPIECVLLECGHMATCMTCGKQLSECPVCRQFVVRCVRTFKA